MNKNYHPMDLLHIASKFRLQKLLDESIKAASKIPRVYRYSDFEELDFSVQCRVMSLASGRHQDTVHNKTNTNPRDRLGSEADEYDADTESDYGDA